MNQKFYDMTDLDVLKKFSIILGLMTKVTKKIIEDAELREVVNYDDIEKLKNLVDQVEDMVE